MEHELVVRDTTGTKLTFSALHAFLGSGVVPISVGEPIDEGSTLRIPIEFDLDELLQWAIGMAARRSPQGPLLGALRVRRAEKKAERKAKRKAPAKKKAAKK